jgi:hypothetical protein
MLNEFLLYTIAILVVIFLMAPSNHVESYTGEAVAIEVVAIEIISTIEYADEVQVDTEWVLDFTWSDEEVEEIYPTGGVLQWVDEWDGDVELISIAVEVRQKPILLLPAAKEAEVELPILPTKKGTAGKGFGKPNKKGKTKKK